jgi:ATP-dependent DNA helicase RecG
MTPSFPTLDQLQRWLSDPEDERLEFKEAKTQFDSDRLTKYCVALANEGGGYIVLGVTDKRPRSVVGTKAFENLSALKRDQSQRVHLHIDAIALNHPDGRVVVISVPPRPIGTPIESRGAYWMRRGEDLVAMSAEVLGRIFAEGQPDYSAQICPAATRADIDAAAVEKLRSLWMASSKNTQLASLDQAQLLEDTELTIDGKVTYAALILLGTQKGLSRHLAQAETIFEYRSSDGSISAQQRQEFRKGFLLYLDELWTLINLRNEVYQFQDGLFRRSVPAFNERAVREALLNALAHRDYRMGGSIFVRQYPKRLEIVSPGGFPLGITAENLLWRQAPRNRRVAEVMARCDLVERSGQGADLMFSTCIKESKPLPDFSASDDYEVSLLLSGQVQDEQFLRFLERVGAETLAHFNSGDFLLLDAIHHQYPIPDRLRGQLPKLLELGIIERRARGGSYLLSERFYKLADSRGTYTRRKGLDKETNKALLYKHIKRNKADGSPLRDLQEVLPASSERKIRYLLVEMKNEGLVHASGRTRASRWYPGADQVGDDHEH